MRKSFINTKPYLVLLLVCPIIALIGWLRRDYSVDLQLYDTYYMLRIDLLAEFLITVILITSLIYWLTRKRPGFPQLTAAHVLGTIGISLYIVSATGYPPNNAMDTWAPMSPEQYRHWEELGTNFAMALVTLAAIQIILIANLVAKWLKAA